jgi:hypothetical protein
MSTLKIICPSAGRPRDVLCTDAVHLDGICVPESEVDAYRKHNQGVEVLSHPDTLKGLAAKRQWIYDTFGDVFMIDDDVDCLQRNYLPRRQTSRRRLPKDEATDLIHELHAMACDLGVYLFAPGKLADERRYTACKPVWLIGYVNGAAFGLRKGSGLFFHPEITGGNDCFISGLNAHKHRMAFIDNRFGPRMVVFTNPGGLAPRRSADTERKDFEILKASFGSAINTDRPKWLQGTRENAPFRRTLKIPF